MAYTGFTIPNEADASFPAQAKFFRQDLEIIAEAQRGNGVISGCAVTAQGTPDMTLAVAAGLIRRENRSKAVAAGNVTITAADATNPRIDIVSVNDAGTKVVTAGTPAATPSPPAIPQVANINNIVLAFVWVPANDTAIAADQITDKRVFVEPEITVAVASDVTHAQSDTNLSDITGLTWDIGAGSEMWYFEATLMVDTPTTPDVKIGWGAMPSGATMVWGSHSRSAATFDYFNIAAGVTSIAPLTESSTQALEGRAGIVLAHYKGWVIGSTTAGAIQMQFAQNTGNASNTIIKKGSMINAWKIVG